MGHFQPRRNHWMPAQQYTPGMGDSNPWWSSCACGCTGCSQCEERGGQPRKAPGSLTAGATLGWLLTSDCGRGGADLTTTCEEHGGRMWRCPQGQCVGARGRKARAEAQEPGSRWGSEGLGKSRVLSVSALPSAFFPSLLNFTWIVMIQGGFYGRDNNLHSPRCPQGVDLPERSVFNELILCISHIMKRKGYLIQIFFN